jgi:hypothetical protein
MEFINELKSPQDIPEVVGVDWAASDRVLLACQDGGIRIMGLGLSGNRMDLGPGCGLEYRWNWSVSGLVLSHR